MNRRLSFHELAEGEMNDAAAFYDSRQPGLGREFIHAVQQATQQIIEQPEAAQLVRRTVWRKVLRRFPYNIIYSVKPDVIRILAIANQKRRPFYWRFRT